VVVEVEAVRRVLIYHLAEEAVEEVRMGLMK
jgi:hypothetical protein